MHQAAVDEALASLQRQDTVRRLWRRDHTLWKQDPAEISDRLGWLDTPMSMRPHLPALKDFAREARAGGIRRVVVLGMGGSSLGPEALRRTFASAPGFPALHVLDSTVPASVQAMSNAIDPAGTLFLVSSKSGSTIEPLSFYKHFRPIVQGVLGSEDAGRRFAAITDPGSPLERLAGEHGFRRTFLNPPDIGGRYSVLSYFGLVPAALQGIDLEMLLARAQKMAEACGPGQAVSDNPGAWLGAVIAALALRGRDKLTLVASPGISSFGLWAEQLIAESTGKEGKGIVPVNDEPPAPPAAYGDDRLFVYMRLMGQVDPSQEQAMHTLEAAGQPVLRLDLRDAYDLGAEFFRWEFATAIAGHILGIHPFDQPDVQRAKDATERLLMRHQSRGTLPSVEPINNLKDLLEQARPGDYLAIMAYTRQTPGLETAMAKLRLAVITRWRIATTFGYGPRFLHSTGQLHKGGPNNGLFLQITEAHAQDLPVPGESYTFGALVDAQALGDLHALQSNGRRVARVHLAQGYEARMLERLAEEAAE
ncbi:MAG: glucose-6-phosphate isomerase [Chloroflexi bacterium]|nr:glucose-6-phosphate isomerase [Chloroflexota bacterium]